MSAARLLVALRRPARLALLALLALNLGVAAAFTVPRTLRQRRVDERVAELKAERAAALERLGLARARQELLARNQREARQLTGRLIGTREDTLVAVLDEIESAGRELSLRFGPRNLNPMPVKDAPLTRLAISLPVEGSYQDLVIFLRRLEHSRRFLTVDSLSLREREGGQRASLDVSISAYFRGEYQGTRRGGRGRS